MCTFNLDNEDLNKVFYNNMNSYRMVVVRISSEKENYHKINYFSSGCYKYIGYEGHELIGKNLNTI